MKAAVLCVERLEIPMKHAGYVLVEGGKDLEKWFSVERKHRVRGKRRMQIVWYKPFGVVDG